MQIARILPFLTFIFLAVSPAQAEEGGIENLRETGKAFASVARSVSPSVVNIQVEGKAPHSDSQRTPFGNDLFKRFFGDQFGGLPRSGIPQHKRRAINQGSGFIFAAKNNLLSKKSYILTNNHVVENAERIRVKLNDGREFDAQVTGTDPQSDVAVLEIKAGGLPALSLGDSSQLEVGEWVVAIGNPFGLSNTLTVGVVSAKGRSSLGINDYEDFIQTDAAINPGNSGGPLVNLDGEAVGINTAIFSRSGGYMGVGFAIPIDLAKGIAYQLMDKGEVKRGYLGVVIQDLTPELSESFDLGDKAGILVAQVANGSPAAEAGLREGDVITAYQDKPVANVGSFRNRVSLTAPGSQEKMTIIRDGKQRWLTVTIGQLAKDDLTAMQGPAQSTEKIGLTVQTLTPQLAEQLGTKDRKGVVVTEVTPGSIAAMAGIKPGTIITQVNQNPVKNAAEFKRTVENSREKRVLLLLRRGDMQQYLALRW